MIALIYMLRITFIGAMLSLEPAGDNINYGYLFGYIYPRSTKTWFGLGKIKSVYWLEIYLTRDMLMIKHYLQLYVSGNYDQLHAELKHRPKFKEMEAPRKKE
jgi:hypothetical protein